MKLEKVFKFYVPILPVFAGLVTFTPLNIVYIIIPPEVLMHYFYKISLLAFCPPIVLSINYSISTFGSYYAKRIDIKCHTIKV